MHALLVRVALLAMITACLPGCLGDHEAPVDPTVAGSFQYVVYGEDDRKEVYRFKGDAYARASQSLVALIPPALIKKTPGGGRAPSSESAQELLQLCADEPFVDQPAVASCSGVLIDDDLVLTAGHCFEQETRCDAYAYVFDYHYSRPGQAKVITDLDVYGCKRVLVRERQMFKSGRIYDFAVVQLDRDVDLRRRPVPLRLDALQVREYITVMGSPQGLPSKIDAGGTVQSLPSPALGYWYANTDTFGGSSGSPAYDKDLALVGFLIRGNRDYEIDPTEYCMRAKRIDSDEQGAARYEQFAYLAPALTALCATAEGRERAICQPPPLEGKADFRCSVQHAGRREGSELWAFGLLCLSLICRTFSRQRGRG